MDQKIIILIVVICFICVLSVSSIAGAGYIYSQTPKEEETQIDETSIDETPTPTTPSPSPSPSPSTSTSTSTPSTSTSTTSTTSTPEPTTTPAPTTSTPTATVDSTPAPFVPITYNMGGIAIKSVSAQKYLNVPGARKENYYPIDIYDCDDNLCPDDKSHNPLARSNWTFTNNSEIINRNSQKCLDIKGEIKDGAQVGQWDCNNGSNQKWIAYQDKTIRPKDNNKLCLDVIGNKQDNASPVGLFTCNNNDNQKWSLTKAWNNCVFWDQTNPATNKAGWCKKDINHAYFEKHIGRIGAGCGAGMGYGVCGM
jgi:hypothetical protein